MTLRNAKILADYVVSQLFFHCERIEIAGAIRRKIPDPYRIDIIVIPELGTQVSRKTEKRMPCMGYVNTVMEWQKIKGEAWEKSTRRFVPIPYTDDTGEVVIHIADEDNFGYLMAMKTGSGDFIQRMASSWSSKGYKGIEGHFYRKKPNEEPVLVSVPNEIDLFRFAGMAYIDPPARN